jgi:hypothetical protein
LQVESIFELTSDHDDLDGGEHDEADWEDELDEDQRDGSEASNH